jgi:hypothetical protein
MALIAGSIIGVGIFTQGRPADLFAAKKAEEETKGGGVR